MEDWPRRSVWSGRDSEGISGDAAAAWWRSVGTAAIESRGFASDCHRWADGRLGVVCRRLSEFLFNLHRIYTVQVKFKKIYLARNPPRMIAAPSLD